MKLKPLLLLTLIVTFLLSACSGFTQLNRIQNTDYFSGIKCEIPLQIPYGSPTSEFLYTDDDIGKLKIDLDSISMKTSNFTTESLPFNALMIVYKENSKNALYLLDEFSLSGNNTPRYKHGYRFSDFSSCLHISETTKNGYKIRQLKGIPVPHHLFEDMSSGNYYENKEIIVKTSINEFFEFYQMFQKYNPIEVQKEGNVLTLKNITVDINLYDQNGKLEKTELTQLQQVILTFSKNTREETTVCFSYKM